MRVLIHFVLLLPLLSVATTAQSYRSTVNDGNDLYREKKFDQAAEKYKSARTAKPDRIESYFNLGNVGYRTEDLQGALEQYKRAGERARSSEDGAQLWYNAGNTFMKAAETGSAMKGAAADGGDLQKEGYRQAIDAYKRSLKLNPGDEDARYNLAYAMKKLEDLNKQKQNSPNKNQDQKQNKDQKQKDQQQKQDDQNKNDEQQKKDQKQKEQDQKQKEDQQKQQQMQQKQMPKQQAEQILKALERDERDLQKKLREKRAARVHVEKDW